MLISFRDPVAPFLPFAIADGDFVALETFDFEVFQTAPVASPAGFADHVVNGFLLVPALFETDVGKVASAVGSGVAVEFDADAVGTDLPVEWIGTGLEVGEQRDGTFETGEQ